MLLSVHALTASRSGDAGPVRVLDAVELEVEAGTLTDVAGASGAGKTTLLLALARLLPGAQGTLALDGVPAQDIDPSAWRRRVAYLPQRPRLAGPAVRDDLLLPWSFKSAELAAPGDDELRSALDGVGLSDVALDRDVSRLSAGQVARVALLRTILTGPAVLLLDEPDASLDDESAAQVTARTAAFVANGGAVVRVRHARVDAAADRRFLLTGGRLEAVVR